MKKIPQKNYSIRGILLLFFSLVVPVLLLGAEGNGEAHSHGEGTGTSLTDMLLAPRYLISLGILVAGMIMLAYRKVNVPMRILWMGVIFLLFGYTFTFPFYPSPLCALTKPFFMGIRLHFLAMLIFMLVTSLVITKGFCGSICAAGALQEIIYFIPLFRKIKARKVPFVVSNSIRAIIFILFVVLIYSTGVVIYDYFNLFDLFHWNFEAPVDILVPFLIFLAIVIAVSFITYRPFCHFICPIGLFSWLIEQVSLSRVKLNHDLCTECNQCVDDSPCLAIRDIMDDKWTRADCYLCGKCIEVCPEDALSVGTSAKGKQLWR